MTLLKVVGAAATTMTAGAVLLLQTAGGSPEITGAVLLSATTLALLLYLVRRVQMIPREEGVLRHEANDRVHAALTAQSERFDTELQRMEARLLGAITAGFTREAEERHTFEARLRECELAQARRGDR